LGRTLNTWIYNFFVVFLHRWGYGLVGITFH
jgi:hypothetical protein